MRPKRKSKNPSERIVVTGVGAITAIGSGRKSFWKGLADGKNGVGPIRLFDTSDYPAAIGGVINDFDPSDFMPVEIAESIGRASQLALAAARQALDDAHVQEPSERAGVYIGTTMGESQVQYALMDEWYRSSGKNIPVNMLTKIADNMLAANVFHLLKLSGHALVFPTACAAGNYSIGYACDQILSGRVQWALAGGADAFSKLAFTGFGRMLVLAPEACQPFDKNRKGIVVSEGAGILHLETLDRAERRDADIYAEVLGYGMSCDANHMTIPALDGVTSVMQDALKRAEIHPDDLDLVCAHGTGTRMNDKTESDAIIRVLGREKAMKTPVNSIKSMLGHTMGAASALEAIACLMSIHEGIIAPTINYETPDEDCPLNYVPNKSIKKEVNVALNNAFAFGANNSSVVFSDKDFH